MAIQKKKIRVLPNPWAAIDHAGRASGACPCDPNEDTPDRRWVGATPTAELVRAARTLRLAGQTFEQRPSSHDLTWTFSSEPIELPNTPYYRDRIRHGELVAADAETAELCGITGSEFLEPKKFIEQAKAAAILQFDAENGEDAFAELNAERVEKAKTSTSGQVTTVAVSKQVLADAKGGAS